MSADEAAGMLISLISLMMLWVGLFWLYPMYIIDSFRQQMFAVRDQMFLDAADEKLSFDDDAYDLLRTAMNGSIRSAHKLSIVHVLLYVWLLPRGGFGTNKPAFSERVEESLAALPDCKREAYEEYARKMDKLLVKHFFLSSPLVAAMVFPYLFVRTRTRLVLNSLRTLVNRVEGLVYIAGRSEFTSQPAALSA